MILVEPQLPQLSTIETSQIISVIDEHASSTALIVLPGIQYYTGQYFDIARITAHAHNHGITIGWDLAHAVGNVDVKLHDWNVDFAVWCNYKYLNSGPGAIAGLFVHDNHGRADMASGNIRPRLSGWWGGDKTTRFQMGNSKLALFYRNNQAWYHRFRLMNKMLIGHQDSCLYPVPPAFRLAIHALWPSQQLLHH